MNITRRSALITASAAIVAAGTPAAVNAAARGNPDAALFALLDELERVDRDYWKARRALVMELNAIGVSIAWGIADRRAYEAKVERIENSPKVSALRALRDKLICRSEQLAAEIRATPAGTVAGVLRKVQASNVTTPMIASAMRDLELLAGEARS